jgi:hypothetical protein
MLLRLKTRTARFRFNLQHPADHQSGRLWLYFEQLRRCEMVDQSSRELDLSDGHLKLAADLASGQLEMPNSLVERA